MPSYDSSPTSWDSTPVNWDIIYGASGLWDVIPIDWDDAPVDWDSFFQDSQLWDVTPVNWDSTVDWDSPEAPPVPEPEPPPTEFPDPPPALADPIIYTTPVPPQFLQDLIFGPVVTRRRRVDIFSPQTETRVEAVWMADAPLIDGNVSVDMSRPERRMLDLVLDNEERALDHHPNGFWYDKIIKIYHGVETPTAIWETQIGEFMIDDIREAHFPHHVMVKGRDYAKKLMADKFPAAVSYPAGRPIAQIVRSIANAGGVFKLNLDDDDEVLGIATSFERNTTRWEAIQKLADAHSLEVFFDRFGYLVLRPYRDPMVAPVVFTFMTGAQGNLANYEKASNDKELYNHVTVTGAATGNRIPVFGEAENTNPASATSVQRIGRRTLPVEDPLVVTVEQANRRAAQLLRVASLQSYEINLGAILAPWLDVGDAVEFIDPRAVAGQPTRFLLSTLEYPIALGPMTANGKRLTIVTSTGGEGPGEEPPPPPPPTGTAPTVTSHPVALLTAQEGTTFSFTALGTGNPTPTVQWQWATSTGGPWNNISGATSTTLSETATTIKHNNYYRAVFTNSAGTVSSNPGRLNVSVITTPPETISVGRARLAWYYFDANTPPSDSVINAWAPQLALVVLHPKLTSTRDKIKAANPRCKVLMAKSLWTTVQTETAAPFTTALSYQQALTGGWLAQDNVTSPPPPSGTFPATIQAESFVLVNPVPTTGMQIESARAGYNGTGYISRWYQDGERVRFTYQSDQARTASIKFRHVKASESPAARREVYVNSVLRGTVDFPATGALWASAPWVTAGSEPFLDIPLVSGTNTIELVVPGGGDGIELDQIVLGTAVGTTPPPPPPPPGGGSGTGRFDIDAQGNFIDPLGRRTVLWGANGGIQNYILTSSLSNGQLSVPNGADWAQWGWNFCRLVTLPDFAAGGTGSPGPTTLQQLVDRIIALHNDFAAREMVLMVTSFESGVGTNPAPGATPHTDEMFRRLVDAIGDSPWFWINYQNEPYWEGGGGWINYHNHGYNLVRSRPKGVNTMFVVDAYQSGQAGAGGIGDFNTFRSGKHHVVYSYHAYMAGKNASTLESERTQLNAANIAWIIGEYAYQPVNQGSCCGGTYTDQRAGALKIINEWIPAGESSCWWIATADFEAHTLRQGNNEYNEWGAGLNEAGQALWNQRTRPKQY